MPRTDTGLQPRPRVPDHTETADLCVAVCSGSALVVEICGEIDIWSAPELGLGGYPRQREGLILPLSDGMARRFPVVNVVLVVASFAVWLFAHVGGFIFGWIASPDRRGTNRPLSRGNRLPQSAPDQRGHSRKVA